MLRFSIGFGRAALVLAGRERPITFEYWLSVIPLGGYVKMLDEREGPVAAVERHRAFNQRPVWQRIAVLLAGPAFNFLFAILAYWVMFATRSAGRQAGDRRGRRGLCGGPRRARGRATRSRPSAAVPTRLGRARHSRSSTSCSTTARIELTVREPNGATKNVVLDVRGREAELTEPAALFNGLGIRPGPPYPPWSAR